MDKRTTGLYAKFNVRRTDGSDQPGGKHEGCQYFVLDATHDPHAIPALRAYADSCRAEYPLLARDLDILSGGDHPGKATCQGDCNPFVASCGAQFCTMEEQMAHERAVHGGDHKETT